MAAGGPQPALPDHQGRRRVYDIEPGLYTWGRVPRYLAGDTKPPPGKRGGQLLDYDKVESALAREFDRLAEMITSRCIEGDLIAKPVRAQIALVEMLSDLRVGS